MNVSPNARRPVSVLGATGLVGQRIVRALERHPWFELVGVAASERSAGRTYAEAVRWLLPGEIPPGAARLTVARAQPAEVPGELVFSALDAASAREIEPAFAKAGRAVVSNASAFRMETDVPLVVAEVNPGHVALLSVQRERRGWPGFIAANPNCSVIGLVLALAPLHRAAGVARAVVTTLQATSGAGYPGVPSLDVVDSVIPGIPGEEPKLAAEPCKILGELKGDRVEPARIAVSPHTHRVPVVDGHLLAVSVETRRPLAAAEAARLMAGFRGVPQELGLPSAPPAPLDVRPEPSRPQPRLDRDRGAGMVVTVGRVRECPVLGLAFEALVHNTERGAAGGTLLLGELLAARGLVP